MSLNRTLFSSGNVGGLSEYGVGRKISRLAHVTLFAIAWKQQGVFIGKLTPDGSAGSNKPD